MLGINLVEAGHVPDLVVRAGIRRLLRRRLNDLDFDDFEAADGDQRAFRNERRMSPIAPLPELANEQHYEVSPAFFEHVLGPRHKYSCGLWSDGVKDLAEAEEAMLALC